MTADTDHAAGRPATASDFEREAERTRRRLAENLDELSDRLTPQQVFNEVLTYSRVGGGTMFRTLSTAVRENPVPSLLIGTGCMLFVSEKMGLRPLSFGRFGNGGGSAKRPDGDETYGGNGGAAVSASAGSMSDTADLMAGSSASSADSMAASVGSGISDASEAASRHTANATGAMGDTMRRTAATVAARAADAADATRATAHDLQDRAAGAAEQARGRAQKAADAVRESAASMRGAVAGTASSFGGSVTDGAIRTRRQAAEAVRQTRESAVAFVTEQPLLCAAIGVAVGAALASFLPATEAEDRLMGDASDAVKDTAGEVGSEAFKSPKNVASKAAERAQSAAMEEGLRPSAVADAARKLGEGIGEGAKDATSPMEEPVTGTGPQEFASGDPLPH